MARHARGEPHAFEQLMARYRAPVYGYLVRCGVPARHRDDVFQEAFMKLHRAAASYRPDRALRPWLFTIVANTVRSHFRRQGPRDGRWAPLDAQPGAADGRARDSGPGPGSEPVSPHPSSLQLVEARETASRIDAALARLPRLQREVILLCCVEQLAQADVATALELPVNTVKTHLRRGRLALAQALARRASIGVAR